MGGKRKNQKQELGSGQEVLLPCGGHLARLLLQVPGIRMPCAKWRPAVDPVWTPKNRHKRPPPTESDGVNEKRAVGNPDSKGVIRGRGLSLPVSKTLAWGVWRRVKVNILRGGERPRNCGSAGKTGEGDGRLTKPSKKKPIALGEKASQRCPRLLPQRESQDVKKKIGGKGAVKKPMYRKKTGP